MLKSATMACGKSVSVRKAVILLGPSANNPLERYTIEFVMESGDETLQQNCSLTQKQIDLAKRRVLQKLIEYQAGADVRPLVRTNVFLAFEVQRSVAEEWTGREREFAEVLSTFTFRESFSWDSSLSPSSTLTASRPVRSGRRSKLALHLRLFSKGEEDAVVARSTGAPAPVPTGATFTGAAFTAAAPTGAAFTGALAPVAAPTGAAFTGTEVPQPQQLGEEQTRTLAPASAKQFGTSGHGEAVMWLVSRKGIKALRV